MPKATSMRPMRDWKVSLYCDIVLHTSNEKIIIINFWTSGNKAGDKKSRRRSGRNERTHTHQKIECFKATRVCYHFRLRAYSMRCKKWLKNYALTASGGRLFTLLFENPIQIDWSVWCHCVRAIMLGKCVSGQGSNDDVSTIYENLAQVRASFHLSQFARKINTTKYITHGFSQILIS